MNIMCLCISQMLLNYKNVQFVVIVFETSIDCEWKKDDLCINAKQAYVRLACFLSMHPSLFFITQTLARS